MSLTLNDRRRRHSQAGLTDASLNSFRDHLKSKNKRAIESPEPPPRPQSTPGERPTQRRRRRSPSHGGESDFVGDGDPHVDGDYSDDVEYEEWKGIEDDAIIEAESDTIKPDEGKFQILGHEDADKRPTRPLPISRIRSAASSPGLPPSYAIYAPSPISLASPHIRPMSANPVMLPHHAHVAPRGTGRRLYVILSQACLESYRISVGSSKSHGGRGRKGEGEAKYTLLNCDDHQGILAKTGRDIADARPDITHQACLLFVYLRSTSDLSAVSPHPLGLSA